MIPCERGPPRSASATRHQPDSALPVNHPGDTLPNMTDTSVATAERPAKTTARPALRVTGKLRDACDYLVHEGLSLYDAARKAEISTFSMREGLKRPHVLAYVRQQREILRTSMCGANILALANVRDQTDNQNARVSAVKALEQIGDDNSSIRSSTSTSMPGVTIHIHAAPAQASLNAHERDVTPKSLITLDGDILDENVDR